MEEDLQRLVEDFLTQKQILLVQVKKGILSKEQFLREVLKHIEQNYHLPVEKQADLLKEFEQYVLGYSRLSPLMDDGSISDIRVVSHDCIRIKREGKRMDAGIAFASEKEYRRVPERPVQAAGLQDAGHYAAVLQVRAGDQRGNRVQPLFRNRPPVYLDSDDHPVPGLQCLCSLLR